MEARYLHGAGWFPGVVHAIRGDGSLCIHYDDGDTEDGVSLDAVRALGRVGQRKSATMAMESIRMASQGPLKVTRTKAGSNEENERKPNVSKMT